jgi:hypothetical protein
VASLLQKRSPVIFTGAFTETRFLIYIKSALKILLSDIISISLSERKLLVVKIAQAL